MTVKLSIAIASHLSDAQMEMEVPSLQNHAKKRMNLVKLIVSRHSNLDEYVEEEVLNKYWDEL